METTGWSADMALGIPLFDEAHQALAEQVKQLLDGPDEQFEAGMARLTDALEEDFRLEESLMEAIDYPAICSHREQHARVLATLHGLEPGDIAAGRKAAGLILPWFELHLATADTALAIALQAMGQAAPAGAAS
ncbi:MULTISPECIES: bacteriohemerythrin [Duganella]|jgi:hemerythrin-like metal-binding protein|uniref:bacteriohemerythrin n=1 Tax=Duganella TaxID=75654 RepID=UPI00159E1FD9